MPYSKDNDWTDFSLRFQSYFITCLKIQYNLSQSQIAEELSLDQATISRIENLKQGKDIHHEIIYALDKYFPGIHIMDFLDPSFTKIFHKEVSDRQNPLFP